jgi:hypothetical protein
MHASILRNNGKSYRLLDGPKNRTNKCRFLKKLKLKKARKQDSFGMRYKKLIAVSNLTYF